MTDQLRGVLYASVTAFFWGFLAIALKAATQKFEVVNLVWFRFVFAFIVLFAYYLIVDRKQLKILIQPPLLLLIAALGLALNYYGFTNGVHHTSPSTAQVVIQFGPILLGLVGFVFFKEKINKIQMLGFGIAFVGLALFYFNQISEILDEEKHVFNLGFFWVVIGALAWLTYASLQKILVKSYNSQVLNLVIFGLPAFIYTPFVSFTAFSGISISDWLLLIFLGANTLIAYGCLSMAFKYADVNKVSVVITLNPIITFITMALLFKFDVNWIDAKPMDFYTWVGAVMVIAGAVFVVYFRKRG
jgi:drug/metabolite transporter (DMT)-like permease